LVTAHAAAVLLGRGDHARRASGANVAGSAPATSDTIGLVRLVALEAPAFATAVLGRELVAFDTGLRLEGIGLRLLHAPGHRRGLGVETMTAVAAPDVTHIAG